MIHISNLNKRYFTVDGEITALDNVSLDIAGGEFIAIIGKSGSGKTTLLNMIAGLDNPDSGSILLNNADVTKMTGKQTAVLRRREIGVIYQFYNLIPELNVVENITLPTELDGSPINSEWLAEILKVVGLSGRENAYPTALSGGQQQRAAIARALFGKPSLILADEPTGNLDNENSAEVMKLLKAMNEEYGITVLIVTHSDAVAEQARRVISIADGKITSDRRK
ncbi:MAG: ABC transporter ATP-binding protein [Clostridia bacterium]|nr:ABC transporter ATP-binding protein [Clostridia bacterium]